MLRPACLSILFFITYQACAQQFRFDDPNIIFKDTIGNTINSDEVMDMFMKYSITIKQNTRSDGKRELTLVPSVRTAIDKIPAADISENKYRNTPLPEFKLKDLNDVPFTRDSIKGRITIINFWFTGCKPCIIEMPELNRLVDKYSREGIIFIAPALDDTEKLRKFFKSNKFDYRILVEADDFAKALEIPAYPTHVLVDNTGNIYEIFSGTNAQIYERLDGFIENLIEASKRSKK